ncbi:hypothetical protein UC34_20600 [Pandoraea vervacti]|uniref:PRA1 family protein n=2 Tax=Pandoraea vervacti TaxID=656178 RepID=A0ABN4FSI3_9BURK|nr:hypothetical protein UC34_20600 [Pandoraea vervacti]
MAPQVKTTKTTLFAQAVHPCTRQCFSDMSPQAFRNTVNLIYHGRNVALTLLLIALLYNQTFWVFASAVAAALCTGALHEAGRVPQEEALPPRPLVIQIIRISVPLLLTMFALGYGAVWLNRNFG